MVTGASTAGLAVIFIDARKGVLTQIWRHSYLVHLLGIRNIVLAVNKMDLVGYERQVFDEIVADYRVFAASIGIAEFMPIPISGFRGDNIRHRLNKDLGFTEADRVENIRRVGQVAPLMTDAGLIVITAFISPFRAERRSVREMMVPGEFLEIYVDTPLGVSESRDVKGLYKKARSGKLKNFTGIDSPYEAPESPETRIDTTQRSPEQATELIVNYFIK